jgi:hypothetical protein
LHRELHVPEGQKIPASKLAKAAHSDNPTLRRRVALAKTLKGMHKAEGGSVKGDKYEPVRREGLYRLKTQYEQRDAPEWVKASDGMTRVNAGLVRRRPAFAGED